MEHRELLEYLRSVAALMDLAAEGGEQGDWDRVEQGMRDVHEQCAVLMQEIRIKRLSEMTPEELLRKVG
jgi:hypothetical protein